METEVTQLRKEVEALRQEFESLRGVRDSKTSMPDWFQRFSFDGKAYLRYSYELDDNGGGNNDFNEFDIDRIYLGVNVQLWDKGKVRYTLEGGDLRENGTDQFETTTKHFYLEIQDVLYSSNFLRFGQTDLPWVSYEDGLWEYRVQGPNFPDRSGYLTSTDLGVAFGGKIPDGYGSWQANIANGEGWKKNEAGKHKDFHARLTVNPLAGTEGPWKNLFLTAFASFGTYDDSVAAAGLPDDKNRYLAMAGYKEPDRWTLVAETLWTKDLSNELATKHPSLLGRPDFRSDGKGSSVFATLNMSLLCSCDEARKWELVARRDQLDPDDQVDDNDLTRYIGGVSYRWNRYVQTLLDYETANYDPGAAKDDERRIMLQCEVKF